jgi:hypothetical protein
MARWTTESLYRDHPAYELGLLDALDSAHAHALAGLSIELIMAAGPGAGAAGVENELRQMLRDYETRTNGGQKP